MFISKENGVIYPESKEGTTACERMSIAFIYSSKSWFGIWPVFCLSSSSAKGAGGRPARWKQSRIDPLTLENCRKTLILPQGKKG